MEVSNEDIYRSLVEQGKMTMAEYVAKIKEENPNLDKHVTNTWDIMLKNGTCKFADISSGKIKDLNIFDAEAWINKRKNPLTPDECYDGKNQDASKIDELGLCKQPLQFFKTPPSREYVLNIAAKVPVTCLQELFDNAEKIQEWLKEPANDEQINNYFDCSAV